MLLKNPTKEELSIQFDGAVYTVAPESEISVPDPVAKFWQENIHNFVVVSVEKTKTVEPVVIKPVATVAPVVEEKKEETPVEAPIEAVKPAKNK